ncbi:glycerol kinase GlpK [Candidatus Bipolaricaulota bacterium]|nr:glycerol kinase GlpK [Candidatus Bipolaricaulota bacterium]
MKTQGSAREYVGAVDLGTSGVRFVVFDHEAQEVGSAYRELPLSYPRPGWVEQDPELMFRLSLEVAREGISRAGIGAEELAAIGITNQRETTIVWERSSGRPLAPAIVWQDRRTAPRCEKLRKLGQEAMLRKKTGLHADPYFSATKLEWLFTNVPGLKEQAARGEALFGTVDSWLLWKLGGVHATDPTNASRTLLFDIHRLRWDPDLLSLFGVPEDCLPCVRPSLSVFGKTKKELFGAGIPLAGVLGDQQAALFGQVCFGMGEAKVTWGTGAFLLLNTGDRPVESRHGLLATVAYTSPDGEVRYALEGSVFIAGAAIQWLRDGLGIIRSAAETEALAGSIPSTDGVYFVPALVGLGAPHWDPYARGAILGITRGTKRAHLVRAGLEAIAYQTNDVLRAMEADAGLSLSELKVDGGAAANNFLCQFQSDVLGIPVVRPKVLETTALGAAFAAGLSVGFWEDLSALRGLWCEDRRFLPAMSPEERERLLSGWRRALSRAKGWAKGVP